MYDSRKNKAKAGDMDMEWGGVSDSSKAQAVVALVVVALIAVLVVGALIASGGA